MSALAIPGDHRRKIIASARLLESNQAGERQAAFEAIGRLLPSGMTIADLIDRALNPTPMPSRRDVVPVAALRQWQRNARLIASFPALLDTRERAFVVDMERRSAVPTPKQANWLNSLLARVEARAKA